MAKARRVKLPAKSTELDDPEERQQFLAIFGDPPSERAFIFASRIALSLSAKLTAMQAMNRFHCSEFIRLKKDEFYERAPTSKQVGLGEWLAEIKDIEMPEIARADKDAWENFMAQNITRDDRDRIEELVWGLQEPNVDLTSFGTLIKYLSKEKELRSVPGGLKDAKELRIKEMLIAGTHPDSIQEAYPDFTERQVSNLANDVEAQGYEIAW